LPPLRRVFFEWAASIQPVMEREVQLPPPSKSTPPLVVETPTLPTFFFCLSWDFLIGSLRTLMLFSFFFNCPGKRLNHPVLPNAFASASRASAAFFCLFLFSDWFQDAWLFAANRPWCPTWSSPPFLFLESFLPVGRFVVV